MARDRYSSVPLASHYFHSKGTSPYYGPDTFTCVGDEGISEYSAISDEVGSRELYNPLDHSKQSSSLITWEGYVPNSLYAGQPIDWYWCDFKVSSYLSLAQRQELEADEPDIPWSDLIVGLADDVKGRLESRSLLAVTIRELPKTYRMVTNPFSLLRSDWRQVAGKSSASALASRGANIWLEGRYGWNAGFYDLKNFTKSSERLSTALSSSHPEGARRRLHRRWSLFEPLNTSFGLTETELNSYASYSNSCTDNLRSGIRVLSRETKAVVSTEADDASLTPYTALDRFRQAYGLDWASVLPSLWEAMPYSFVVDWFVHNKNIRHLPSMNFLMSQPLYRLGYSVKTEYNFQLRVVLNNPWSNSNIFAGAPYPNLTGNIGRYTRFRRVRGLPTASSVFLGADLSAIQAADLTSLIIQKLSR